MHIIIKNATILFLTILLVLSADIRANEVIHIQHREGDMTSEVRALIENTSDKEVEIIFEKGIYHFNPDYAVGKYCAITNHDNGWKRIIFDLEGYNAITIKGNGAELIFHGQVLPFQFHNCNKISVSGLTIDWDIPFTIQGEVLATNEIEGWIDLRMFTKGFSWEVSKGKLKFPNINEFSYSDLGNSLAFDATHKRVAHGAWDANSSPSLVETIDNDILRIHEDKKHAPAIGDVVHFKGPKGENRYAPAFHVVNSQNINFEKVVVHHALGMGFLMERTRDITLSNCGVYVREGSDRVVSATADATHFCNCSGDILVENSRFQHMLDDGTNVHGTYVVVDEVIDNKTLRVGIGHFQQAGFEFAGEGDEVWFVHQPDPSRAGTNTIKSVKVINEIFSEISFLNKLPKDIRKGDLLENKTWNPTFTMRGCTIKDHRARNIVLKTPKKVIIENNDFSSMMSSILFRGESYFWFESGALEDVTIRNNRFNYCAYSGAEHAIFYITPRLGKSFDQSKIYDRNIKFENNTITNFDHRIVWADRVDGLVIKGNKIIHQSSRKSLYPDAPLFDFSFCKNVTIEDNEYHGGHKNIYQTDEASQSNIIIQNNKGFSNHLTEKKNK